MHKHKQLLKWLTADPDVTTCHLCFYKKVNFKRSKRRVAVNVTAQPPTPAASVMRSSGCFPTFLRGIGCGLRGKGLTDTSRKLHLFVTDGYGVTAQSGTVRRSTGALSYFPSHAFRWRFGAAALSATQCDPCHRPALMDSSLLFIFNMRKKPKQNADKFTGRARASSCKNCCLKKWWQSTTAVWIPAKSTIVLRRAGANPHHWLRLKTFLHQNNLHGCCTDKTIKYEPGILISSRSLKALKAY